MNILVRVYAQFNVGDDLFLHILFTRYPYISFKLIAPSYYKKFVSAYKNVSLVGSSYLSVTERICCRLFHMIAKKDVWEIIQIRRWRKLLDLMSKECNGYIYIGGSVFIQGAPGFSTDSMINKLLPSYFPHSFIIGANWGPYIEPSFLEFHQKEVMPRYEGVCFRDTVSYELFKDLSNTSCAPDVVFQYVPQPIEQLPKTIGFSVMDFSWRSNLKQSWETYLSKTCDAITKLHAEGYSIHLFSFCKGEGDEFAIEEIKKNLPENMKINIHRYNGNLQEYLSKYAQMEIMVAVRFHSLVLSLIFQQKICPLIYSNKVTNILTDLNYKGVASSIINLKNINLYDLIKLSKPLSIDLDEYRVNAQQQFAAFDKYICKI